jgi:prefoldin beta subunit
MELSEEMQGKLAQFQQLQQQIQMIATQKYQIDIQITEIEKTVEELGKLKKNAEIYKSVGNLLVRQDDKAALTKELEERKETLGIRVKTLGNQEKALRDRHRELQEELSKALGKVEQANS